MTEFIFYPNYTARRYFNKKVGYWYIEIPKTHPKYSRRRRLMLEHRWIMEQHLGRYLTKDEHVHHINAIRTDNRIENMILTKGHSDHQKTYHPYIKPDYKCLICGTDETVLSNRQDKYFYYKWSSYKDGYICHKCYMDIYNEKLKREHANQTEFVKCQCDPKCKEMIPKYTRDNSLARYKHGHNKRKYKIN